MHHPVTSSFLHHITDVLYRPHMDKIITTISASPWVLAWVTAQDWSLWAAGFCSIMGGLYFGCKMYMDFKYGKTKRKDDQD